MNEQKIIFVARVAHEANRAYCESIGDNTQLSWDFAPEWQKDSTVEGVKQIINNPGITSEMCHALWMQHKIDNGWVFGNIKDAEKKTHPCITSYDDLPLEQLVKDIIFISVVKGMIRLDRDRKEEIRYS